MNESRSSQPILISGAVGSPYTRKMLAILPRHRPRGLRGDAGLVLTGEGKFFCNGLNVAVLADGIGVGKPE